MGYGVNTINGPWFPNVSGVVTETSITDAVNSAIQIGQKFGSVTLAPLCALTSWQLRGAYGAGTAYVANDIVAASNVIYRCIQAGTGHTPASSPTYWTALADDMPRFMSVIDAAAGKFHVQLGRGLWAFQTDPATCGYTTGWPSHTSVSGPGATVVQSMTATGAGSDQGSWLWAVWSAVGGAAYTTVQTTPTIGTKTVVSATQIAAGSDIAIQNRQADVWQYQRFHVVSSVVIGGGPTYTLTLDRPIEFAFTATDPIWVLTHYPQDIQVDARGMTFAPSSGDCIAEIAMGDNCKFNDARVIPDMGYITQKYISITDVGSTHVECCRNDLDCNGSGVGSFGVTVESAVDADVSGNQVRNCGGTGLYVGSSANVRGHGLQLSCCKFGLGLLANETVLGHGYAGKDYSFVGGRVTGCTTYGVYIWDDARGTVLDGMSIESNTGDGVNVTGTADLRIRNCSIQYNGGTGLVCVDNTTTGVTVRGSKIKNNTTADITANGSALDIQGVPVSFTLGFYNSTGTLKHAVFAASANGSLPSNRGTITGLSNSWNTTPLVKSDVAFTAGGGIDNGTQSEFVFDSDAIAADADLKVGAAVIYNDSSKDWAVEAGVSNINVNGVTRKRLRVKLYTRITGTPSAFNVTNIPSQLYIKIHGEMV